jgi:hypothetical protein
MKATIKRGSRRLKLYKGQEYEVLDIDPNFYLDGNRATMLLLRTGENGEKIVEYPLVYCEIIGYEIETASK